MKIVAVVTKEKNVTYVFRIKRRTIIVIMCEQCGNEFNRGRLVKKEEGEYIKCPYCGNLNKRVYRKKNKKRDVR